MSTKAKFGESNGRLVKSGTNLNRLAKHLGLCVNGPRDEQLKYCQEQMYFHMLCVAHASTKLSTMTTLPFPSSCDVRLQCVVERLNASEKVREWGMLYNGLLCRLSVKRGSG